MDYQDVMHTAVGLLRKAFAARFEGGLHAEKVRAQAYADGYLRALVDAALIDEQQLLELIQRERQSDAAADVPALRSA